MRLARNVLAFSIGIFFGGSLAYCSDARADGVYGVATLRSYHFDRTPKRNENNLGLGLEIQKGDWSGAVGYYNNSFERTTVYGLAGYTPYRICDWHVGATFGLASGYNLPLFLAAVATRDFGRFGINIAASVPAVAVQVKWRFSE